MDDSTRVLNKARKYISGGFATDSKKTDALFASDFGPAYFKTADGVELTDYDGNRYVDFGMGLGACILGYNHPVIVEAIQKELKKGIVTTLSSPLEPELAELIVNMFPSIEQVRFLKTGAEACSAAVRLSRAYTYREYILASGYFGWHDWSNRDAGVPIATRNLCIEFLFNDPADFLDKFNNLPEYPAAVILESVVHEAPKKDFIKTIRDICTKCGIVLILDEMKTGARLAPGGAQEYYKFLPDLSVIGKGIAGGMPLAAIGGKKDIMDSWRKLWMCSTLAGEALSLAAAIATLKFIKENRVHEHLQRMGTHLFNGFKRIANDFPKICEVSGIPHMARIGIHKDLPNLKHFEAELFTEVLRSGFIIRRNGYNYVSYAHKEEHIRKCLDALYGIFELIDRKI
jgi:glutamate-1-semialdehyde 2,1-aminomutase